jgi:hypothetical protein
MQHERLERGARQRRVPVFRQDWNLDRKRHDLPGMFHRRRPIQGPGDDFIKLFST